MNNISYAVMCFLFGGITFISVRLCLTNAAALRAYMRVLSLGPYICD